MSSAASRPLTDRQRAVIERIDRRVPIKVIAQELGVSETRINQHIRALKDIYEAESLSDLVELHRIDVGLEETSSEGRKSVDSERLNEDLKGYSETSFSKNQLPERVVIGDQSDSTDPGELVMSDVLPLEEQAPWLRPGEPRVVPRVLDGEHAVWFRLAAIMGIAFGFLAAVVLTVTAAVTISEALDGRATVSVDEKGFS